MATTTPIWTDNVPVIPATTLSFGSLIRVTIDLRGKFRAMLGVSLLIGTMIG